MPVQKNNSLCWVFLPQGGEEGALKCKGNLQTLHNKPSPYKQSPSRHLGGKNLQAEIPGLQQDSWLQGCAFFLLNLGG